MLPSDHKRTQEKLQNNNNIKKMLGHYWEEPMQKRECIEDEFDEKAETRQAE